MNYKKVLSQWDESLEYFGWAEWLPLKERRVRLFDHNIIKMGNAVKLKWERIVNGKHEDNGRFDCVYCLNFYNFDNFSIRCSGCPIEYFIQGPECIATPYFAFRNERSLDNAKKMQQFVDEIFIKSLLLIDWRKYYEMPSLQEQED